MIKATTKDYGLYAVRINILLEEAYAEGYNDGRQWTSPEILPNHKDSVVCKTSDQSEEKYFIGYYNFIERNWISTSTGKKIEQTISGWKEIE